MSKIALRALVYCVYLIIAAGGLAEVFLRVQKPHPKVAYDWILHPKLGHTGPVSEVLDLGGVKSFYNEMGFRSDWLATPSPDEAFRSLVILGDSITEANDLNREETYPGMLKKQLKNIFPRIHTLASADYGTLDELLALHLHKDKIKPQQIVLQFLGLNDYLNNTLGLAGKNKSVSDFVRPYVIPDTKRNNVSPSYFLGELPITPVSRVRSWLIAHSLIFRHLYSLHIEKKWDEESKREYKEPLCATELEIFLEEPSDAWKEGIEATGKILRQLKIEAGAVPLLAVYFPSNIETDDFLWLNGIEPQLKRCFPGKKYSRLMGEARFLSLASNAKMRAISLRHAFWAAAPDHKTADTLYLMGGHLSPLGHKVAANAIAQALK